MKTKLFLPWGMTVILLLFFASCEKDKAEDDYPYYAEMGNEEIIKELKDVPAYVYSSYRDCVLICYSEYADEFYETYNGDATAYESAYKERMEDIRSHQIGVKLSDFNTYGIELPAKVYVSASVTNNHFAFHEPNILDYGWGAILYEYKAYLGNLKPRN